MTIGANIRHLRKARKLTLNQLAVLVDSDVGNLSRLERGVQGYSDQMLGKLAGALGVPVAAFFAEDEQHLAMIVQPPKIPTAAIVPFDENVRMAPPTAMGLRPIPVISSVQAGALRDMEQPYPPGIGYAYEYTDQDLSDWAFALDVEGVSMMPEFRPGDRIIIEPELAPNPGDFVVARNGSAQATFKKYRPRGIDIAGNMVFELVPLNDDYPILRSDTEQLTVIGVMTEHRKKYRRV